jgi:hypothetical protein
MLTNKFMQPLIITKNTSQNINTEIENNVITL